MRKCLLLACADMPLSGNRKQIQKSPSTSLRAGKLYVIKKQKLKRVSFSFVGMKGEQLSYGMLKIFKCFIWLFFSFCYLQLLRWETTLSSNVFIKENTFGKFKAWSDLIRIASYSCYFYNVLFPCLFHLCSYVYSVVIRLQYSTIVFYGLENSLNKVISMLPESQTREFSRSSCNSSIS